MRILAALAAAVLAVSLPLPLSAQEAAPADVESPDAIVAALYDVISGPAGQARDWDRFRSLFIPDGARLIPVGRAADGTVRHRVMAVEEYIETNGPLLEERGFFEREIGRTTEAYSQVAHLFSAYESRSTPEAEPFDRGINSIQLMHDGTRWWIVSVMWDSERSGDEIPARYVGG